MGINRRQVKIINLLLASDRFIPTAELARGAGCSERTVRSDTRAINAFLERNGLAARTDSKRGNGIRLRASAADRERVLDMVEERALAVDAALDRFYRGMLLITCDYNQSYTVDSLARAIFTNKQQVQEDLQAWGDLLAPYRAAIVRGRHLSVEGPEEFIRFFIVYHLFELASTAMKRRIEPRIFGTDEETGNRIFFNRQISRIEEAMGKPFTDNARHQIAVYLQIMVFRIKAGHTIGGYSTSVAPMFEELANDIEERFGISVAPSERIIIRDLFTVSTRRWTPDFHETFTPGDEGARIAATMLDALGERFGRKPPSYLEKPLAALAEAALTHVRLERSISLPRENTWAVRFENMTSFLRLSEVVRDTPGLSDISFYETDCTRIAMLLLSYLDGLAIDDLWNVGLVVNCGIEQVFYARDRIERLIPCTRIQRVMTEEEFLNESADGPIPGLDLFISFDPIKTDLPLAVISNAISDVDRVRINEVIVRLGNPHTMLPVAHLADGIMSRPLAIRSSDNVRRELHAALVEDGLWRGALSSFPSTLEMNSFYTGEWMIFTVFSDDVAATGAMRYEVDMNLDFTGQNLHHILVLTVSREDERILTALVQKFRELALEAGLARELERA